MKEIEIIKSIFNEIIDIVNNQNKFIKELEILIQEQKNRIDILEIRLNNIQQRNE
jgi:hypothetical protein